MDIVPIKKNESLQIGETVKIIIRRIYSSGEVELGIQAPKDVPIYREEFLNSLKKLKVHLDNIKDK